MDGHKLNLISCEKIFDLIRIVKLIKSVRITPQLNQCIFSKKLGLSILSVQNPNATNFFENERILVLLEIIKLL